jgi:hypothetical protein
VLIVLDKTNIYPVALTPNPPKGQGCFILCTERGKYLKTKGFEIGVKRKQGL